MSTKPYTPHSEQSKAGYELATMSPPVESSESEPAIATFASSSSVSSTQSPQSQAEEPMDSESSDDDLREASPNRQARSAAFKELLKGFDSELSQRPSSSPARTTNVRARRFAFPVPQADKKPIAPRPMMRRKPSKEWTKASALKIRIKRVPLTCGTWEVYETFSPYGNVSRIELNFRGNHREAFLILRPVPKDLSWISSQLHLRTPDQRDHVISFFPEPIIDSKSNGQNGEEALPEILMVPVERMEAGMMQSPEKFLSLFTSAPSAAPLLEFGINTRYNDFLIKFGVDIEYKSPPGKPTQVYRNTYQLKIPFSLIKRVCRLQTDDGEVALAVSLEMPPFVWRKTNDIKSTHDVKPTNDATNNIMEWRESQAWFRQTGIDKSPGTPDSIIQLRRMDPILDVGRWLTYYFVLGKGAVESEDYTTIFKVLTDHNVSTTWTATVNKVPGDASEVWKWADELSPSKVGESSFSWIQELMPTRLELSPNVQYQLEVCISNNWLSECNLTSEFVAKLAAMDPTRATRLLEKVADGKQRHFSPMEIFKLESRLGIKTRKSTKFSSLVRAAIITPTTIYFYTPVIETSNRIVRQYKQYEDRFLRVKFTDERWKGRIMTNEDESMNEVFTRVKRTMRNGIRVGNLHYEFLAFNGSQVRENGAYFFAASGSLTAEKIRMGMGNLGHIDVVAKYAARLGQCLSTTKGMSLGVHIQRIPDIERNGFCFTDGVGKISPFLAQMVAQEIGLGTAAGDYPSVFQFHLGGCKGVLAVDPAVKGKVVQIRPSQEKFPARHQGLEICRFSQFSATYLNLQLILVLEALGVPATVFTNKMAEQLHDLEAAMKDEKIAVELLNRNVDFNGMTITMAEMICDGFMGAQDPFLKSCLHLWRAWRIKYLKEKARLSVDQGAFVLGCVDETGTLKGHSNKTPRGSKREEDLPEIFLQISEPMNPGKYTVITGVCILARNPSLHPGDIRVVKAVDAPQLHHLKDCVVLPQTGDRDLANMCSGGDLDGDDYLVMWDPDLLPEEWNYEPMDYKAPPPVRSKGPVTVHDITSFFVMHMKNDTVGLIASAHRYWADKAEDGVKSTPCLELASLHSMAVDYAKTGVPARYPKNIRFKPPYPHWAEKSHTYKSTRVLGKLYDAVDRIPFEPVWNLPFDKRITEAYTLSDEMIHEAAIVKQQYDEAVRRIMTQYGIGNEFQVWTTFIMEHNQNNDYKFSTDFGEKAETLKQNIRDVCFEKAGTTPQDRDWDKLGPFIAAMYVATAKDVADACERHKGAEADGSDKKMTCESMPFMSFPWIFHRELGQIANKRSTLWAAPPSHLGSMVSRPAPKKIHLENSFRLSPLPDISTADGVVHEGELLDVHHKDEAEQPFEMLPLEAVLSPDTVSKNKISKDEDKIEPENEEKEKDEDEEEMGEEVVMEEMSNFMDVTNRKLARWK